MSIPYRTQQQLKRAGVIALIVLVIAALIWGLWILWLQRYVVYTRESGAVLDFSKEMIPLEGPIATQPEDGLQIEVHYNEGDDMVKTNAQMAQMNGYYVDAQTLVDSPEAVWEKIQTLPEGTAVMIDMKSIYGTFYYTTSTGMPQSDSVNAFSVDQLLENLRKSNYYTIARIPALRDREFALYNTHNGIPTGHGYLWMDEEGCYYLNPTTQDTVMYLINIATELREKGFCEVLFDEYHFPPLDEIQFSGDPMEALANTAQTVVDNCATGSFTVSFVNNGFGWTVPEGRTRVYMDDVADVGSITAVTANMTLEDPEIRLVFLTNNMDTRYEKYSVLRPIYLAH